MTITSLSQFINESLAEKDGNEWIVYVDGQNKLGAISQCKGTNEFEAKEDAWEFYQRLVDAVKIEKLKP